MNYKRVTRDNFDSDEVVVTFYGRVSTKSIEQKISMEYQIEGLEDELIKHPNWKDSGLRYNDNGRTGTSIYKRTGFKNMIKDAKEGKFNLIVMREVSRFARYTKDYIIYLEELQKAGVEIFFSAYNILSNESYATILLHNMAIQAQIESENKSKYTKDAHEKRRNKGFIFGSDNRFGWDLIKTEKGASNKLVINKEEAEVVSLIFDLYIHGKINNGVHESFGIRKIASYLNENNYKTKTGSNWYTSTVNDILRNKCFCGYVAHNKSVKENLHEERRKNRNRIEFIYKKSDCVEKIIEEDVFERAQRLAIGRKKISSKAVLDEQNQPIRDVDGNLVRKAVGYKPIKNTYAQKLICECESTFKVQRIRRTPKNGMKRPIGYTCYRYDVNALNGKACLNKTFDKIRLDLVALRIFNDFLKNNEDAIKLAYDMILSCYKKEEMEQGIEDPKILEKKLANYKAKEKILFEDYVDNKLKKDDYYEKEKYIKSKILEVEKSLTEVYKIHEGLKSFDKKDEMKKIQEALKMVDTTIENEEGYSEIRQEIINHFVSKIVSHADGSFDWYINLSGDCDMGAGMYINKFSEDYKKRYSINQNATLIDEFVIGYDEANNFVKSWGRKSFQFKRQDGTLIWRDIKVKVFIEF